MRKTGAYGRSWTQDARGAAAQAEREGGFFIIWNPDSDKPPQQVMGTYAQAETVSRRMAETNPGEVFYVMEAVSKSVATTVATKLVARQIGKQPAGRGTTTL